MSANLADSRAAALALASLCVAAHARAEPLVSVPARVRGERTSQRAAAECVGSLCCAPNAGLGFVQGESGGGPTHNFELVVPRAGTGLSYYYRDNAPIVAVHGEARHGRSASARAA